MVRSELIKLWNAKENRENRQITIQEVAKATELKWETINNMLNNRTTRFDRDVIAKLCDFFDVPEGSPVPFLVFRRGEFADEKAA